MTTHDWTSCKCDSCGARRADFRVNHKARTYPKRVWREFRETGDTALLKEPDEVAVPFDGSKSDTLPLSSAIGRGSDSPVVQFTAQQLYDGDGQGWYTFREGRRSRLRRFLDALRRIARRTS